MLFFFAFCIQGLKIIMELPLTRLTHTHGHTNETSTATELWRCALTSWDTLGIGDITTMVPLFSHSRRKQHKLFGCCTTGHGGEVGCGALERGHKTFIGAAQCGGNAWKIAHPQPQVANDRDTPCMKVFPKFTRAVAALHITVEV